MHVVPKRGWDAAQRMCPSGKRGKGYAGSGGRDGLPFLGVQQGWCEGVCLHGRGGARVDIYTANDPCSVWAPGLNIVWHVAPQQPRSWTALP